MARVYVLRISETFRLLQDLSIPFSFTDPFEFLSIRSEEEDVASCSHPSSHHLAFLAHVHPLLPPTNRPRSDLPSRREGRSRPLATGTPKSLEDWNSTFERCLGQVQLGSSLALRSILRLGSSMSTRRPGISPTTLGNYPR